jgi:hypothetical protein
VVRTSWHIPAPTRGNATWQRLAELTASGHYLLHGSQRRGLKALQPRAPLDFSLDAFSKQTAVFVTEDPTWAIAYGIRTASCRLLSVCFYPGLKPGRASQRRLFLSYAATAGGRAPTSAGVVYVLPAKHFTRMPSYTDPLLGPITECQWASTETVPVVEEVPVQPQDLPVAPLLHDFDSVSARSARIHR